MFDYRTVRAIEVSGNAIARGPCVDAVHRLLDIAETADIPVYLDVDLRPSEWDDPADYGRGIRSLLPRVDVVIGTEEEFFAALMPDPDMVMGGDSIPAEEAGHLDRAIDAMLDAGPGVVVVKRGARGVTLLMRGERVDVPGFTVDVRNTVGAGDSFAAGLIRSRLVGLDWEAAATFANACGAIVVTRDGCSAAFPTEDEVLAFLRERGRA